MKEFIELEITCNHKNKEAIAAKLKIETVEHTLWGGVPASGYRHDTTVRGGLHKG
jgi:hypothetical protein